MSRPLRILISAGEASGDRLGAGLATALRRLRPDVEIAGMGGERMAEAGVEILQDASTVSVVGIVEVLSHLRAILGAKRRIEGRLGEWRPDLFVPIDFPEFNLRLAAKARSREIPVVYFVSPQVWAWRRRRVHTIRRLVRRILVLFPFEAAFYEEAGVPVTFVGHPVVETPPPVAGKDLLARAGLDPGRPVVALLPGSRRSEVRRLLPPLLGAAQELATLRPGLQFLIPHAPGLSIEELGPAVAAAGVAGLRIHRADFPEVLGACTAGAVTSGTASLEAAVMGLPMVVIYRMGSISYWIGRALVEVDHIALPNLVVGRRVVPELVQGDCTPRAIARILGGLLDDTATAARMREELREVRLRLGEPGVFDRAAAAVLGEAPDGNVLQ